jgi:hypothetical protein
MTYWLGIGLVLLVVYGLIVWEDKLNDGRG